MTSEELLQRIEARIGERCGAVADHGASDTVELDQTRTGRLSRMDALQGQAMAQAVEARRQAECRRLAAARARVERGEGGMCTECGEPIAAARLRFDPAAVLCRDCAEAAENGG